MTKKITTIENRDDEVVTRGILKVEVRNEVRKEIKKAFKKELDPFKQEVRQEFTKLGAQIEVLSDNVKALAEGLNNKVDISAHEALERRVDILEGPKYI